MEIKTFKGYADADFELRFESASPDSLYVHCEVRNWNSKVLRTMYKVFAKITDEAKQLGYKEMRTITPNPKFASLFAFRTESRIQYGGKEYEVMVWEWN